MAGRWRSVVSFGVSLVVLAACGGGSSPPSDTGTDTGQSAVDTGAPDMGGMHADTGPQADMCATHTDCVTCFEAMNCGWCATTSSCRTGNAMGSGDGSCRGTSWSFGGAQAYCPDAVAYCAMNTDCASCTRAPVCGWCPGTGTCLPGTQAGPVMSGHDSMCTGWAWAPMDCTMGDAGPAGDGGAAMDAGTADAAASDVGPG